MYPTRISKLLMSCLLLIILSIRLHAQTDSNNNAVTQNPYEYYIRISGANTRDDVEFLQNFIVKKPGIIFFMANRFPVKYFLLRSDRALTAGQFGQWLNNRPYAIEFYGAGKKGLEEAVVLYNKTKTRK